MRRGWRETIDIAGTRDHIAQESVAAAWACATLLVAAALLSTGCVTPEGPYDFVDAPLHGMVYDYGNRPVGGAEIIVRPVKQDASGGETGRRNPSEPSDSSVFRGTSGGMGRFRVDGVPRGRHEIVVRREGFEEARRVVEFESRTQILYVRMPSYAQLLARSKEALAARRWCEAGDYIERAGRVAPEEPDHRYYGAVLDTLRGEYEQAARILEGLLSASYREAAVYLALADLSQYRLDRPGEAVEYLRGYLRRTEDGSARRRLQELERKTGDGSPDEATSE